MSSISTNTERKARAARFKREAANPPPAPVKNFAHPGGKITTSDKDTALLKLLERKGKAGLALTEEQQQARRRLLSAKSAASDNTARGSDDSAQLAEAVGRMDLAAACGVPIRSAASDACRKLQKKIRQIEHLEERLGSGEALEANQHHKIAQKTELQRELSKLQG